jgi:hypothetical protein
MRVLAFSAAVAFATIATGAAHASDADFRLRNRTGYQIDEVYVSPHHSSHWGHDLMGDDSLDDGESVKITFPHSGSACHFDIQVKYHDGDKAEWSDVNLCNYERITLHWDAKNQVTRADGD